MTTSRRPKVTSYAPPDDPYPRTGTRAWTRAGARRRKVALVAVMRDEAGSIPGWAADLRQQSRLPDEVVVVDDGSRDGSAALLADALADLDVAVSVLSGVTSGIAVGRNRAIAATSAEIIAVTDLGLGLAPDWLERITEPFEVDPATQVVGGFYTALGRDGRVVRRRMWPTLERVDPATFLPASRSLAFTRDAWALVGGYPEWLTLTGEDTWFAVQLRERCSNWAFAPRAVVRWQAPDTVPAYWRKARYWAAGDGESGLFAPSYRRSAIAGLAGVLMAGAPLAAGLAARRRGCSPAPAATAAAAALGAAAAVVATRSGLGATGLLAEAGAQIARTVGWVEGRRRRSAVQARRAAALAAQR